MSRLGVNKNLIKIIHNPIKVHTVRKQYTNNEIKLLWGDSNAFKILSIGSLKYEKDFITTVKALSMLEDNKNIKFLILGEGTEKNKIVNLIRDLSLDNIVKILGFKENISDYYSTADLFISSSIHEGFGNVVADALSYGINIISTNSGGPGDILSDGEYGDMCEVKNPAMLADLINKNRNTPISKEKSDKNYERASVFEINKISKEYIKYINEII